MADPSRLHFRLNGPLAPPTMATQSSKNLIPKIFLVGKSQIKLLFVSLLNFSLDCWIPETGQASSLTDMSTFLKIMLRGDFKGRWELSTSEATTSSGKKATEYKTATSDRSSILLTREGTRLLRMALFKATSSAIRC